MSANLFLRRLHLYLGLALLPPFFLYGISSIAFSHPSWFQASPEEAKRDWILRFERPFQIDLASGEDDRAVGARILRDINMEGAFGVWRPPGQNQLHVIRFSFLKASRASYYPKENRLVVEDRRFRWGPFLTGMHGRGGFEQESLLNDLWAVLVDVVCFSILAWIATGLYLWWKRPPSRSFGWIAIACGCALFGAFVYVL
jgi:hypothetical protein